ncbi:MAG: hypothetical protein ABR497_01540 [Kiritimatiellia bacterium]|nr:hypothetical protein [Lentisphaerota bacterium]
MNGGLFRKLLQVIGAKWPRPEPLKLAHGAPMKKNIDQQLEERRFFLKDTIRQQTDFSGTGQALQLPPPLLQKACPVDTVLVNLPDASNALRT